MSVPAEEGFHEVALPQLPENTPVDHDEVVVDPTVVDENSVTEPFTEEPRESEGLVGWIKNHKVVVAAGVITVASIVANPLEQTLDSVKDVAPYVVPSMIAAEAAWIGGAAMMLAAIGKKIRNPLKIRSHMDEITKEAASSTLFNTGLAVNTAAAVAEFAIPVAAVATKLPIESWGILAFSSIDLWATVVLRRMIWRSTRRHAKELTNID